jgi:hypothetical protein
VITEDLDDVGDGRSLLTDGNVDTEKSLGVISIGIIEG